MLEESTSYQNEKENVQMNIDDNGIIIAIIFFVIFLGLYFFSKEGDNLKIITKQDLADYYGVVRKTLNKWITHFTTIDSEQFKKVRKITFLDYLIILEQLGIVSENSKPLTKKEIKNQCETTDRVLRANIKLKFCGLSKETYKKMNIFPPKISTKIVEHMG